jgi:hypothetical protein
MSFQKSTRALKNEVLEICGELTDGTSDFETIVVKHLNNIYRGLLSGGNEFGIDVSEPWVWAQSKRPIPLSLEPYYQGSVLIMNGSTSGTLSVAPIISLVGRFIRFTNRSDIYRIVKHDAGTTDISLDQPYLELGGVLSFTAYKIDYALVNNVIVVDESNNKIDFSENAGTPLVATLTRGAYSPSQLAVEVVAQMNLVGSAGYTASFNELTRKFSIAHGSAFSLLFASGPNIQISAAEILGFDIEDKMSLTSYTSAYANSGILRLTKPIQTYRAGITDGEITLVDDVWDSTNYGQMSVGIPDKFAIVQQDGGGLWTIRMNSSLYQNAIRCEVNHIPVPRKLVDSDYSFPLTPQPHDMFLVYGAAHYTLLDKTDGKADQYKVLAAAKLQAMVNDNRKNAISAGRDYGRIVPRDNYHARYGFLK